MANQIVPGYTGGQNTGTYGTAGGGVTAINPNQQPMPPIQQPMPPMQQGVSPGDSWLGMLSGGLGNDLSGGSNGGGGTSSWGYSSHPAYPGQQLNSNPTHVQISPDILNSMQQYSDAAYNQATRQLDPQWQQQQAAFAQQMVSQGLTPGSQAYDSAMADFNRGKNDAYAQARDQSMQQGLQAQGQSFQEGLGNSQLANALAVAQTQARAQQMAAGIGANASMHNADINAMTQRLLGLGNLGIEYGNLQNSTNATDFNMLNGLTGQMSAQDMYNNSLPGQQIGNFNAMYQNVPRGGPAPIDVTGAYQMNQNGQLAGYNADVANNNSQNQMYGALGSAAIMAMMMMSSRELKDDQGPQSNEETLDAIKALPLHRWNYKSDDKAHIGTFAEDFNERLGLPKSKAISVIDMFGALLGSVQALAEKVERLEARTARA